MKVVYFVAMMLSMFLITSCASSAQKLTKEEKKAKKEWKKKMKKMEPLNFRDMYEEYNTLKAENSALRRNVEKVQDQAGEKNALYSSKEQELADLEKKLQDVEADCGQNVAETGDDYTKGKVFKVQIGAYKNMDLTQYQSEGNFTTENADGFNKYVIGFFREYHEAKIFKDYLNQMGVKGAWIVSYIDNQRVPIEQAAPELVEDTGR